MTDVITTRDGRCLQCGEDVTQTLMPSAPGREIWLPKECEKCRNLSGALLDLPIDPEAARRAERLRWIGVPHGYERCTLDNFSDRGFEILKRKLELALGYIGECRDFTPNPLILVLLGIHQTGKTHFAIGLARVIACDLDWRVQYTVLADLVRALRQSWGSTRVDRGEREIHVLERLRKMQLLIIDECSTHAVHGLGDVSTHLYDIVGDRYSNGRPTILISNDQRGGDLEYLLGPAITARIAGHRAVWLFGDDPYEPSVT